jgi:hypothetical protein
MISKDSDYCLGAPECLAVSARIFNRQETAGKARFVVTSWKE